MESQNSAVGITWVGEYWTCRKNFKHYKAFVSNGVEIPLHSFCYIMIEKDDVQHRLVAYLVDLYEDRTSHKKMRAQWLHKAGEIEGRIPPPKPHRNEVFYTRYTQVFKLECCDGMVDVLTPDHLEACMPTLGGNSMDHVYVCGRKFESGYEGVKPFDISSVQGYWCQNIFFSGLTPRYLTDLARANTNFHEDEQAGLANLHEDEQTGSTQLIRSGRKAARSSRRRPGRYDFFTDEGDWTPPEEACPLRDDTVDTVTSSIVKLLNSLPIPVTDAGRTLAGLYDLGGLGNKVEILSMDSGLRGCWFRCTMIGKKVGHVRVSYDHVEDVDTGKPLKEWISLNKTAPPDTLRVRTPGRLMMRPPPPEGETFSVLEPGSAVDAFQGEGWWEGIVTGRNAAGQVQVTFPEEEKSAWLDESKVRISREWVDGQWSEVRTPADIINKITGLHTERLDTKLIQQHFPGNNGILSSEFSSGSKATSQLQQSMGKEGNLQDERIRQPYTANLQAKKVLPLHYEKISIDDGLENTESLNTMNSNIKSASCQTVLQGPEVIELKEGNSNIKSASCQTTIQVPNVSESEEGMLLSRNYNNCLGKVLESCPARYEDLDSYCAQAIFSRGDFSENNGNLQLAEAQHVDVDRDKENYTALVDEISGHTRLLSKTSRKRHLDIDSTFSVTATKSGFLSSRHPVSDLLHSRLEQEDSSLGVLSSNKSTEFGNVEVKHSQYGFKQLNSSTGTSVGGPLFNSVSVQSMVLSR